MPETAQQIAYIPMIFPDADFSRSEINSLPLIQSIDKSVKELKQNFYEHARDNRHEFDSLNKEITNLKSDFVEMRSEANGLKQDFTEVKGEIKTLNARLDGVDKRFDGMDKQLDDMTKTQNGWFMVLGFLVAAVPVAVAIVQHFVGH